MAFVIYFFSSGFLHLLPLTFLVFDGFFIEILKPHSRFFFLWLFVCGLGAVFLGQIAVFFFRFRAGRLFGVWGCLAQVKYKVVLVFPSFFFRDVLFARSCIRLRPAPPNLLFLENSPLNEKIDGVDCRFLHAFLCPVECGESPSLF